MDREDSEANCGTRGRTIHRCAAARLSTYSMAMVVYNPIPHHFVTVYRLGRGLLPQKQRSYPIRRFIDLIRHAERITGDTPVVEPHSPQPVSASTPTNRQHNSLDRYLDRGAVLAYHPGEQQHCRRQTCKQALVRPAVCQNRQTHSPSAVHRARADVA